MIRGQTVITEVIAPRKPNTVIITLALKFRAVFKLVNLLTHDTIFVWSTRHPGCEISRIAIAFSLVIISHSGSKVVVLELWVASPFPLLFLIFGP